MGKGPSRCDGSGTRTEFPAGCPQGPGSRWAGGKEAEQYGKELLELQWTEEEEPESVGMCGAESRARIKGQ